MIQDLSKDSLAANIIARVTNSTFGPIGRSSIRHRDPNTSRRRSMDLRHQLTESEAPMIDRNGVEMRIYAVNLVSRYLGHLVFSSPSHTWQDYLNLRLSLENRFRSQTATPNSYGQDPRHSPSDPIGESLVFFICAGFCLNPAQIILIAHRRPNCLPSRQHIIFRSRIRRT